MVNGSVARIGSRPGGVCTLTCNEDPSGWIAHTEEPVVPPLESSIKGSWPNVRQEVCGKDMGLSYRIKPQ